MKDIDKTILEKARQWLGEEFDPQTRQQVQTLIDNDPVGLTDAFYRDLEFGTGGLRGIMGVGTNRMNRYTVGMATQGLAQYLRRSFPNTNPIKVAIAHDCRNNSTYFTEVAAEILSANGIKVYLFDELKPTPLLSFAVRELGCQAGIVITASHNPKEYNGYKVYWDDGGQLVPPHDKAVIEEVQGISRVDQIKFGMDESLIEILDESFDKVYIERIKTVSLAPEVIARHKDLPMVFTPIHGSTVRLAPASLRAFGFEKIYHVPEQDVTSGDFPTVVSPNPEEPEALKMAMQKGREVDADLVMGTDPDGDRVGFVVKDLEGDYVILNGNQAAALLIYYLLEQWKVKGKLTGNEYIVKTIVTTELLQNIASQYQVECLDVLTGFKYIAEKMRLLEGKKTFIGGGEESYGYTIGDQVRDKDAVISCCMMAEAAAWAKDQDRTLYQLLIDIYLKFGFYLEKLISLTKKGKAGMEEIQAMMDHYRKNTPAAINGVPVVLVKDYLTRSQIDKVTNQQTPLDFPAANVLQLFLEDGSKITMRPSGTEPKIKFYFGVKDQLKRAEDFPAMHEQLEQKVQDIIHSMELK
ncbi:MAG: phospho-sugar mutase [Bacteroidales bacterium]